MDMYVHGASRQIEHFFGDKNCTQVQIHMYAGTDTYVRRYRYICTQVQIHMYAGTDTYVRRYRYICSQVQIHMYAGTDTYLRRQLIRNNFSLPIFFSFKNNHPLP
jgi:hypothetical protein